MGKCGEIKELDLSFGQDKVRIVFSEKSANFEKKARKSRKNDINEQKDADFDMSEFRFLDPTSYEEKLALGEIVDDGK